MTENLKILYKYLTSLKRYRYVFILTTLCTMTIVTAVSFYLPRMYKAYSTFFIEKNIIDSLVKGIAITTDIKSKVKVIQYDILSRGLIEKTLEGINSNIFTHSDKNKQKYINSLRKRTKIDVRKGNFFTVSIVDKDPYFAKNYINTLVGKYIEKNIAYKRNETYGANRFLKEQLSIFKNKLEKSEDNIIQFRKKKGIYFSLDESATLASIKENMSQIEEVDLNLDTLKARKARFQKQLKTLKPTIDTVSATDQNNRLLVMQRHLNDLLLKYTDSYPDVVHLKAEIENLKLRLSQPYSINSETETTTKMTSVNPLHQDVQEKYFAVDAEISALLAKKKKLQQMMKTREKELHEVPETKKELGILTQERDSYKKIYQNLLGRMGKSEVSKQMEIGNKAATFRIVDPAVLPEIPISPNLFKMFLLAVVGGVGCGLGLIYLLESFDSRVRDIDFFETLGIEVLAVIPNIVDPIEKKHQRRKDLLVFSFSGIYFLGIASLYSFKIFIH